MTRRTTRNKAQEDARNLEDGRNPSSSKTSPLVSQDPPEEAIPETFEDVLAEGASIARSCRATGIMLCVVHHPGEKLINSNYPSGLGGFTEYGVCFITDWRDKQPPWFVSPSQDDARAVLKALEDQMEETWRITEVSRTGPLDDEELDTDSPVTRRRSTARATSQNDLEMPLIRSTKTDSTDGDGSSQPDDSSPRHTGGRGRIASLAKRARSRKTSSRR